MYTPNTPLNTPYTPRTPPRAPLRTALAPGDMRRRDAAVLRILHHGAGECGLGIRHHLAPHEGKIVYLVGVYIMVYWYTGID